MEEYKYDEDFDGFIEDFGEPEACQEADEKVIEAYKHKLPSKLIYYWRELGWCSYGEGLLWMVNPAEYEEILEERLKGTKFEGRKDLSVFARSAFGVLYVWASAKGKLMDIDPNQNTINAYSDTDKDMLSHDKENFKMQCFWGGKWPKHMELMDKNWNPLFEKTLKKLGQLKADEMYGWKHHIAIGGERSLENLDKVNIFVYHDIANQLEKPDTSMGIDGLI